MTYWLARERQGQDSDYIQRFDPRFWTVDFPRPMMAAVCINANGLLRIRCEFHHKGELCGLIWASQDVLDHPLLAYEADRDYSRTTLSFDWRSQGVMPLDLPHGPTLTIEGRDAQGEPRSWYVRLWNYATGTPTNAAISLPFSELESGYFLPGETINPHDIDRMFISLVAPDFEPGSDMPLAQTQIGDIRISNVKCEGDRPLLEIGDVIVPPHGEQIATAYDDAYNQTPQRLIRSLRRLGYRGRVLHYVGMSHFFALKRDGERLLADPDGSLCEPAALWHRHFFRECSELDLRPVISLSYELFVQHCPDDWQQLAHDGEPARTGWVPPSALLSPANTEAMSWLQRAAAKFVALAVEQDLPILFQIGEPWWWVTSGGKPCLYDAAAAQAFGSNPPAITSMRLAMSAEQIDLLDAAGELLAQSTIDLADAVRAAASGPADILLLAFTPTILDPEMPELKRANIPLGWAYPAFDRLQLEDYDWLTAGSAAKRRTAYQLFDERLGYPPGKQDYLSGFVLAPEDAEPFWQSIDDALDEATLRGVTQRFVWALPQISRDGYTRLAPPKEEELQPFDDVLYPLALGRDTAVSPEFSTNVAVTASGHEFRNSLWSDARMSFDVGPGIRSEAELGILIQFFRARRGAAKGFRLSDPFDFSSNGMTGQPTSTDQLLGVGDGNRSSFALIKRYGEGSEPQIRLITRVRRETLKVSVAGAETDDWHYEDIGQIIFTNAPPRDAEIRAGFLFDIPVRFAADRLDITGASFSAGEAPSVPLVEIREAP